MLSLLLEPVLFVDVEMILIIAALGGLVLVVILSVILVVVLIRRKRKFQSGATATVVLDAGMAQLFCTAVL